MKDVVPSSLRREATALCHGPKSNTVPPSSARTRSRPSASLWYWAASFTASSAAGGITGRSRHLARPALRCSAPPFTPSPAPPLPPHHTSPTPPPHLPPHPP